MGRRPNDDDFTDLVHAAWPSLYRTAYLMLGDAALAEDLVQTALAKTYASWAKVRDLSAARGYAHKVMVNTAASWFRRKSWRRETPRDVLPDAPGDPIDIADRPDVMAALAALAPRQRAVVVLRFYDDLSVAATAHALDISPGTVKSQTSEALSRLGRLLGAEYRPSHSIGATDD